MKCNTKNSILDINVVKSVYVESCYEIFMSAYNKSNNNDDITHVSNYHLMKCVSFLNEISI